MWATYKCRTSTVTLLLSRNADVNVHGNYHISSLLWAAGRGYTEIVKELLSYGAKVNVGDKVNIILFFKYQYFLELSLFI
jgi:ankyrin repeat-rich membrane spanning protein